MSWQRWLRRFLDSLILLLVGWLLLAAAYVSLGRQFVPAVADYQAELLSWVEQETGRAIQLESLSGEMQGTQPVLTLRGLRVYEEADPDSPLLLALDHVTARVDVFSSLWQRRPVMDALQIEGLSLEVTSDADGKWRLHGLGDSEAEVDGLDDALRHLFEQRRITLLDTRIRISPWNQPDWTFTKGDLTLLNQGNWHRLDVHLSLPDGERVSGQFSGQLPERDWRQAEVDFFAALPASDWSRWLPVELLQYVRIEHLEAGGQLWGEWRRTRLERLKGMINAPNIALVTLRPTPAIEDLQLNFDLQLNDDQQMLHVDNLSLRLDEEVWPATRLQLQRQTDDGHWQARADHIPLDLLGQWLPAVIPQEQEKIAEVLETLAPQGTLHSVAVSGESLRDFADWSLQAGFGGVGVAAWEGVPGFSGITGVLSGTPAAGVLSVATGQWSMQLPHLFPEVWQYDSLIGTMDWAWSDSDGLRLAVPGAAVTGEEGNAAATLALHIPPPEGTPTMDLRVALENSQAVFYQRYLPTRLEALGPELVEWLEQSQLAGQVPQAIFAYQGSLSHEAAPDEREILLYAEMENGSLFFQPGWPALEAVSGVLRLRDTTLDIDQAQARLWDTSLTGVALTTRRETPDAPLRLRVSGAFDGSLQNGLRLMQDTPLKELTGDPLKEWAGAGQLQGQLQLAIPLGEGEPEVDVQWQANAGHLGIPQLQAPLTAVAGQFSYEYGKGLLSDEIKLHFLGQPVTARIDLDGATQRMQLQGKHSIEALRSWPLLAALPERLAQGSAAWRAELQLGKDLQRLRVNSDLQGISLDLPAPLAKTAGTAKPSELLLDMGDSSRWQFRVGDELQGLLLERNGDLTGDIRYRRGTPKTPTAPGIAVSARFDEFDWTDWQQWLASGVLSSGTTGAATGAPDDTPKAIAEQVTALHLQTGHFSGFGLDLQNLTVGGVQRNDGWQLTADHRDLQGRIHLPTAANAAIGLDLQRLGFPRSADMPSDTEGLIKPLAKEDPLADVSPNSLPAMDVKIDQLYWGEDLVGAIEFNLRPSAAGATIGDIDLALRGGLQLQGDMTWGKERSRFIGGLQAADIGKVLSAWQYAPTMTSKSFSADGSLDWPGSPAAFALGRSSGSLSVKAENGMLQSGESSADALRVFGLLNFNTLTRRLRLDFSDLFGKGTAYDSFTGEVAMTNGLMQTMSPLVMDGPSVKLQLDGTLDIPADRIDMGLLATLPVTNNLPLAALIAGAPQVGGVLFLVDKILGDRVARFASVKYRISGEWKHPTVEFDRAFDDKAALED